VRRVATGADHAGIAGAATGGRVTNLTMQAKFPCRENAIVTTLLEIALLWLEKRTADRKARGVEGKHIK
jgi:hypothetical protein